MPSVDVYNIQREQVGSVELDDAIFGAEVKEHLFHTVVRQQLANRRAGTHKAKGRSEVSGGGKKPYRQKGTGRARQGTTRAPQWRGGGVVFGPIPRDHGFNVNKKVRRAALRSALSRRTEEGCLTVFDQVAFDGIKTKNFQKVMDTFGFDDVLLIVAEKDDVVMKSARNIPGALVLPVAGLNVYDVLRHKNLAITQGALEGLTQRLGR
jgi:large subunit ribosomal protein L4